MGRDVGGWPTLSGPHKDGGSHVGILVLPDARNQLQALGRVVANQMYARSVDRDAVASVRVGDVLDVRYDGDRWWWVWRDETRVGRLTWSLSSFDDKEWQAGLPRIDDGKLQVIRLGLNANGDVVNAGGIVYPEHDVIPPVREAVPYAEIYVPTLRARVQDGAVTATRENMPGAPRVGRRAGNVAPLPKRTLWDWLRRR